MERQVILVGVNDGCEVDDCVGVELGDGQCNGVGGDDYGGGMGWSWLRHVGIGTSLQINCLFSQWRMS